MTILNVRKLIKEHIDKTKMDKVHKLIMYISKFKGDAVHPSFDVKITVDKIHRLFNEDGDISSLAIFCKTEGTIRPPYIRGYMNKDRIDADQWVALFKKHRTTKSRYTYKNMLTTYQDIVQVAIGKKVESALRGFGEDVNIYYLPTEFKGLQLIL